MLKGILGFFAFLFFLAVLILMLTGSYILKKVSAQDKQAFNHRTETGRKRQQYSTRQSANTTQSEQYSQTTQTSTGETIIDNRHQERENKKIFDDSDGEYVDFEEA